MNRVKDKSPKKRLTIEINNEIYRELKVRALYRNETVKVWVTRAIIEAMKEERKYE